MAEALGYEGRGEGGEGQVDEGGVEEVVGGCHGGRTMADAEASDKGVYVKQHGTNAMKGGGRFQDACFVYLCYSHCACTMLGIQNAQIRVRISEAPVSQHVSFAGLATSDKLGP